MSRPTKCYVNLNVLKENYTAIKKHCKNKVMALVKADAYGHGIIECSKALEKIGADYLGVASIEEAERIRQNGIKTPVLCIGAVPMGDEDFCLSVDAEQAVTSLDDVLRLENACVKNKKIKAIHIKINSGMNRLGVRTKDELDKILEVIKSSEYLKLAGVFTHFASSDSFDKDYTLNQAKVFKDFVEQIRQKGFNEFITHCANSGAILSYPEFKFDMVRAGIILYGYYPSDEVEYCVKIQPVLSFETAIVAINKINKGDKISYGGTFTADKDMLVAVLPVGYGDGYKRLNSNIGHVLINGKKARITGRVCMDMTMVDISDISDAKVGDKAVLIGSQGEEFISADHLASWAQTINYEIPLSITTRVKKQYVE